MCVCFMCLGVYLVYICICLFVCVLSVRLCLVCVGVLNVCVLNVYVCVYYVCVYYVCA